MKLLCVVDGKAAEHFDCSWMRRSMQPKPNETSESEPSGTPARARRHPGIGHFAGPGHPFCRSRGGSGLVTGTAIERIYGKVASSCDCGVDLFFVLSGLSHHPHPLARARGRPGSCAISTRGACLRIFPLYYAALAGCSSVVPSFARCPSRSSGCIASSSGSGSMPATWPRGSFTSGTAAGRI